jgi:hypothetical protein
MGVAVAMCVPFFMAACNGQDSIVTPPSAMFPQADDAAMRSPVDAASSFETASKKDSSDQEAGSEDAADVDDVVVQYVPEATTLTYVPYVPEASDTADTSDSDPADAAYVQPTPTCVGCACRPCMPQFVCVTPNPAIPGNYYCH